MPPDERTHDCRFLDDLSLSGDVHHAAARRVQFSEDASPFGPVTPDAVVEPETTADVSTVLEAAHERGVPVTPWGGGSGVEGNALPTAGGIVLYLGRIDHVEPSPADLSVTVGPGVVYDDLNEELAAHGLRFGPGISSGDVATVGGMIANDASGLNAVRYGGTGDHVRRLEVVLPDGRVIECGSDVVKSSSGYDLTSLFVGSEGTLGVVTEATLGLVGIPEHRRAALATFPSCRSASSAVAEVVRYGVEPGALEFLDETTVGFLDDYAALDLQPAPTLLVELHGNTSGIEEDVAFVRSVFEDHGATDWRSADADRDELWAARRDVLPAVRARAPDREVALHGDVVVPISSYPDLVERAATLAREEDVLTPLVGHAGDGNLHYAPLVDGDDEDSVARAEAFNERVVAAALEMGGTATGEHGVGLGKRKFMDAEHGPAVSVMRAVKAAIDPENVLNPGKLFPE